MKKVIYRHELKNIQIPTDHGGAILTYDVYVDADFGTLKDLANKARESLLKRVMKDIILSQKVERQE